MAEMTKLKNKTQGNVSEAEWEVMRIVWTLGEVHTGEIIEQL